MKLLKVLLRQNGRRMVTLRLPHQLGGREIAVLLCRRGGEYRPRRTGFNLDELTDGHQMTAGHLADFVREMVFAHGQAAYVGYDAFDDEDEDPEWERHTVRWACTQVRRLYPELDDDQLSSFQALYSA